MEYAKKMVWVDPRQLQDMQAINPTPQATPSNANITQPESSVIDLTLRDLERGLKSILGSDDLSEERKANLYSHYFQQYLTMKKKQTTTYRLPSQVTLSAEAGDVAQQDSGPDPIEKEIVDSAPKNLQRLAGLLTRRIKENPTMGWTDRGELVIDGSAVEGSNIVDLVNDVLRQRKNSNPRGWEQFATKLREVNVPSELVRNPLRANYIRSGFSTPTHQSRSPLSSPPQTPLSDVATPQYLRGTSTPCYRPRIGRGRGRNSSATVPQMRWSQI